MIEWIWNNMALFFLLLFFQYALLFEFQGQLRKRGWLKPAVVIFVIQDWLMNIFMTAWFLDLPAEKTELVTGRMKRYKAHGGWAEHGVKWEILEEIRYRFAIILCKALNVWDKGHC